MEALSEDEEPQTLIGEFLKPLGLFQHRQTMRQLGFDNPATDFPAQTPEDAQDMKVALLCENREGCSWPRVEDHALRECHAALSTSSAPPLDQQLQPVAVPGSNPELLARSSERSQPLGEVARVACSPLAPVPAEQGALIGG